MLIRAGYEIAIECHQETPLMALLSVHPSRTADLRSPAIIVSSGPAPLVAALDGFGNLRTRTVALAGILELSTDFIIEDSGRPDEYSPDSGEVPIAQLPEEVVSYLMGSRYCETDRLSEMAWSFFGGTSRGWARVQSIVDYVHQRLTFGYQFARATRTAWEAHEECVGVCRDFAHLAVALCRCMEHSGPVRRRVSRGHRCATVCRAHGFQRLVRGISQRALVHVRRAAQPTTHRSYPDGTRS
jgi:hypothetical protein